MTVKQAKDTLPTVQVQVGATVYPGIVSGRKRKYALVSVAMGDTWSHWEFSWTAVARAATSRRPLHV